jgi:hypothetical protein
MFEMFSPKITSLILDIDQLVSDDGKSHLPSLTKCLIENVVKLSDDDIVYIYLSVGDLSINETLGEAVSVLSNYKEQTFDLGMAIKETVFLLTQYSGQTHKDIFAITNRYKTIQEHRVKKALLFAGENNCSVHFYGIGRHYSKTLLEFVSAQVTYAHFDTVAALDESLTKDFTTLVESR